MGARRAEQGRANEKCIFQIISESIHDIISGSTVSLGDKVDLSTAFFKSHILYYTGGGNFVIKSCRFL
jgi:hypothetical protein